MFRRTAAGGKCLSICEHVKNTLALLQTLQRFPELRQLLVEALEATADLEDEACHFPVVLHKVYSQLLQTKAELEAAKITYERMCAVATVQSSSHEVSASSLDTNVDENGSGVDTTLSEEKDSTVREELFRGGSHFVGTIKIPVSSSDSNNDDFGKRTEYYMDVCRPFRDVFGNEFIMIWHGAHSDEQACLLRLGPATGDKRSIAFGDIETRCTGTLDIEQKELTGCVEQLVYGDEGYKVSADSAVHTFSLSFRPDVGGSDSKERLRVAGAREHWHNTRAKFALELALFSTLTGGLLADQMPSDFRQEAHDLYLFAFEEQPGGMVWQDLMRLLCELNAVLLNHGQQLGNLEFATAAEKAIQLERLETDGMLSRAHLQRCWDAVKSLAFDLAGVAFARSEVRLRSPHVLRTAFYTLHQRARLSYERVDKALREAEARPSNDQFQGMFTQIEAIGREALAEPCCMCFNSLLEYPASEMVEATASSDDTANADTQRGRSKVPGSSLVFRTPCEHVFHVKCAKQWFWRNVTCPLCRAPVVSRATTTSQVPPIAPL